MTWAGKLNDQGQACLSNLPAGSVEFELISEDIEDELKQTRANIKAVLDSIVTEQKAEAAKHEKELAQQNAAQQAAITRPIPKVFGTVPLALLPSRKMLL
jgi:hypothetical protein